MECLQNDPLIEFHPDTLKVVRKVYNLHEPGVMDEAIDIFDSWIKKQNHFTKKDFSREYLERTIIRSKGSVERAKRYLDKMCTARTLVPHFFHGCDVRSPVLTNIEDLFLPKLTKDYYRVYFVQNRVQDFQDVFTMFYKRMVYQMEYICQRDYACGIIIVADCRDSNMFELMKHLDIADLSHCLNLIVSGFGFRLKALYILTKSKLVESLMTALKQVVSKKIGERFHVLRDVEELYNYVDKNILPGDYGGQEATTRELHEKWLDVIGTEEYKHEMEKINEAKTVEELRMKDSVNYQLGVPGTFRSLKMD